MFRTDRLFCPHIFARRCEKNKHRSALPTGLPAFKSTAQRELAKHFPQCLSEDISNCLVQKEKKVSIISVFGPPRAYFSARGKFYNSYYSGELAMARVCQVTGKAPMVGNRVSHANNKTKRRFMPNLQYRRFWVESENRWVRLRVTNAALRTIDKNGIEAVLADLRARGEI